MEDNFNPEIGFKRRDNFKQYDGFARFSPRITSSDRIRRLVFLAHTESYWSADERELETRAHGFNFTTEFEQGDSFQISLNDEFEMLTKTFRIAPDVVLQPGDFDFTSYEISYRWGTQRDFSGRLSYRGGDFWSGTNEAIGVSAGRVEITPQLSVEPSYSINKVKLPEGDFQTELSRVRVTYTISPRMYLSGLMQYN